MTGERNSPLQRAIVDYVHAYPGAGTASIALAIRASVPQIVAAIQWLEGTRQLVPDKPHGAFWGRRWEIGAEW